jgi:predicted DNA-binding transcriptional regulator AlpA
MTSISRAEYKAKILAKYPPTIGTQECAKIVGAHQKTIQELNRAGKLPFRNVSITRHSVQFLTIDVINWLFDLSSGEKITEQKKKGRKLGSKNKPKDMGEGA